MLVVDWFGNDDGDISLAPTLVTVVALIGLSDLWPEAVFFFVRGGPRD